ncbi:MAG: hypothetical protein JWM68_701 [Verrucomicrobiales bacterium]|nr:hypothetical protein [Verrucomicrobiales bacterium]
MKPERGRIVFSLFGKPWLTLFLYENWPYVTFESAIVAGSMPNVDDS